MIVFSGQRPNTTIAFPNNTILEEEELVKIKHDFTIEYELVVYESLIRAIQTNIQHREIPSTRKKSMQKEESMVYWYKTHTPSILDNLWPKAEANPFIIE